MAEIENATNPLQQALEISGARRIDAFTFQTNEGRVVLGSPQDVRRARIIEGSRGNIDRSRRWDEPGYIPSGLVAAPGRRK